MKLVVGLGNPGREYEATKHNVGFWVVDAFAKQHGVACVDRRDEALVGLGRIGGHDVLIAKPQTYMNRSGRAVGALMRRHGVAVADLVVVHDDLDIPQGHLRIKVSGRSGGHRGVTSLIETLGSEAFLRVRIGIGRDPEQDTVDYVLSPFRQEALRRVQAGVEQGRDAILLLLEGRLAAAMNQYNARTSPTPKTNDAL